MKRSTKPAPWSKTLPTRYGPVTFVADARDAPARPATELDALRLRLALAENENDRLVPLVPKSVMRLTGASIESGALEERGRNRGRGAADAREAKSSKARQRARALKEEIKRLRRMYEWSGRRIARHLKVSRDLVSKALRPAPK